MHTLAITGLFKNDARKSKIIRGRTKEQKGTAQKANPNLALLNMQKTYRLLQRLLVKKRPAGVKYQLVPGV